MQNQTTFEHLGFFLEYYMGGKFIGTIILSRPDREITGYYSKIDHFSNHDIILDNGKKIPAGNNYYTRMYPLCGKKLK